jgi:hypothetical protein
MNSRNRFRAIMAYEPSDRVPYFEEGIRQEVIDAWQTQGLAPGADLEQLFHNDHREELQLNLDPRPWPRRWPVRVSELGRFRKRLDPGDARRLPQGWQAMGSAAADQALMLQVQHGYFLSMGVNDWDRFYDSIRLIKDDPAFVHGLLDQVAQLSALLTEQVLSELEVDAVLFSEPIGGMNGPIISPSAYEDFVMRSYQPILEVVRRHNVQTLILRTYANARVLIPSFLKAGFNCLWACECETGAMDYRSIREEFGRDLRLIGGIDLDALRFGRESIRREVMEKAPPLLESGGYIPLADGRVRVDVPFDDYVYYRELLEQITR